MESIGINNMIDILSGKGYLYVPDEKSERDIKKILIGHSIKKVDINTLELDNGIQLEFIGNEGCICGSGEYDISELNDCENIITNVEFIDESKGIMMKCIHTKSLFMQKTKKLNYYNVMVLMVTDTMELAIISMLN